VALRREKKVKSEVKNPTRKPDEWGTHHQDLQQIRVLQEDYFASAAATASRSFFPRSRSAWIPTGSSETTITAAIT
jgi:hypothetical protein